MHLNTHDDDVRIQANIIITSTLNNLQVHVGTCMYVLFKVQRDLGPQFLRPGCSGMLFCVWR